MSRLVPSVAEEELAVIDRAGFLRLARSATAALLAATGGRGMSLPHPAQRMAHEADFWVIQAQTGAGRATTPLDLITERCCRPPLCGLSRFRGPG